VNIGAYPAAPATEQHGEVKGDDEAQQEWTNGGYGISTTQASSSEAHSMSEEVMVMQQAVIKQ